MKKTSFLIIAFLFCGMCMANAENKDSLGLPGDNLSLQAVLELFKKSKNPEDFEKKLNNEKEKVNNLDLDQDGKVDYIRVVDYKNEKAHALVLQVPVNKSESQDVAVIEIEQQGENSVRLQIIGDKLLYGKDYIVEPKPEEKGEGVDPSKGKWQEFDAHYMAQAVVFVNVWSWPCISYIYYPSYVVWVSPWYWSYFPPWWNPWPPYAWSMYYGFWYPYYPNYYVVYDYYLPSAHTIYGPRRQSSQTVSGRYADQHRRFEERQQASPRREQASPGKGTTARPQEAPPAGERKDPKKQPSAEPQKQTKPSGTKAPPRAEPAPSRKPGGGRPPGGTPRPSPRPANPRPR
ncbi:MAG TPA: hypothetical protein VI731_04670 [Bacteroidia bacterium]|nr:hypothetical protein [Bacteroidia bacterium]